MQKESYIVIQSWMVSELNLKGNELIIYALIHGFSQDGKSYFRGSTKYIMENTNMSKQAVLNVLQALVEKGLIIKKVVQSYTIMEQVKQAYGNSYYCLYCTTRSRAGQENIPGMNEKKTGIKNIPGQESLPGTEDIKTGQENVPGQESLPGAGQESLPGAGQESLPNKLEDNKNSTSTSGTTGVKRPAAQEGNQAAGAESSSIIEKIRECFGYKIVFYPDPVPLFLKNAREIGIESDRFLDYIEWAYEYLKKRCKNQESMDGYFYKMFKEQNVMAKFRNLDDARRKKNTAVCPVCGAESQSTDRTCGICGFDMSYMGDDDVITVERQIFNLPEKDKSACRKELEDFERGVAEALHIAKTFDPALAKRQREALLGIYHKYGIRSRNEKEETL